MSLIKEIKNEQTVYFLIDCSNSMYGSRSCAVNAAMEEVANSVVSKIIKQKNADLNIIFKIYGFSGATVKKLIPEVRIENFAKMWKPIPSAIFDGGTPTGAAIQAVIQDIQGGIHGDRDPDALPPPAIILISDGEPNGDNPTYDEVMECAVKGSEKEVEDLRRAIRIAIGVDVNESGRNSLKKFGKVSKKMELNGFAAYYDCSWRQEDQIAKILGLVLLNAAMPFCSIGLG